MFHRGKPVKSMRAPQPVPGAACDRQFFPSFFIFSTCVRRWARLNGRAIRTSLTEQKSNTQKNRMAKALSKSQVASVLAEKVGITKKQAVQFLDEQAALAYKNAKNTFTLPGLGKLVLVNRKARVGRNLMTGESINIPAKRVVKFRIAKAAKDAIRHQVKLRCAPGTSEGSGGALYLPRTARAFPPAAADGIIRR